MDEAVAGDQEPGAAPGTLHLVGDVPVRIDAVLGEELHVSRLEDPVPDGHIPDPEGAEQVRVLGHGDLPVGADGIKLGHRTAVLKSWSANG